MKQLTQSELDQLESLIDRYTLGVVINAMAVICHAKSEHLQTNWQDPTSARHWTEMAGRLETSARGAVQKFGR